MSAVFTPSLPGCIEAIIQETIRHGASYFPGALQVSVCEGLRQEVATEQFTRLHPDARKPVIEDMDILKVPLAQSDFPLVSLVGRKLADLTAPVLLRACDEPWAPNEAAVHRYYAGSQGLGAHRDFSSDEILIAVFTLSGEADFELLRGDGNVQQTWTCQTGGLCLMRAPGLTGRTRDDRPLHRALAPSNGCREAVIYRQIRSDLVSI